MWEHTSLKPRVSVLNFASQLWRKISKLQSLRLGSRLGTNYSTVHVASFPDSHVPRFHPMQYGMWSQLATGAGENKVGQTLAEITDPVVWQLLSKLQVHLSITSSVKRLMYGNALNDSPSGTFDHKSYIKQHIETYSSIYFSHMEQLCFHLPQACLQPQRRLSGRV